MPNQVPIPVTILTGFLGSGKTTLINQLLKQPSQSSIAIIENEFGPVNIDSMLLQRPTNVNIVELTNGCVCCTVRGEFTAAIVDLLDQRSLGQINFDRLIVELTGLADPSPVAQAFFVDERLRSEFVLDGCVAVVDCIHIMQHLDEHPVAAAQIGFADIIMLTKIDRVDKASLASVKKRLLCINAKAKFLEVVNGNCDASSWLNIKAFELSDDFSIENSGVIRSISLEKSIRSNRIFGTAQPVTSNIWQDKIETYLLEAGHMDIDKIGTWMEALVEQHGNDMLRYKGIFSISNDERRLIVQGVHKIVGFDYGPNWRAGEDMKSQLVIIGRNIPIDVLTLGFLNAQG